MTERERAFVVTSTGFHKTHMTIAAHEASTRGLLRLALTAAYPIDSLKRAVKRAGLANRRRIARFLERDEAIPRTQVRALFSPEVLFEIALVLGGSRWTAPLSTWLSALSWRLYARIASNKLEKALGARVFHFRAGFGQSSIDRARQLGMTILCDHGLVHPALLRPLVDNQGRLPAAGTVESTAADWASQAALADIERSDAVLVNSEFVKETFLATGWEADRVHVAYLGVDDNFLRCVPPCSAGPGGPELRLLFAGHFERRKGADVIAEALTGLDELDWHLTLAGPVSPELEREHRRFLADARVAQVGTLRRPELARLMSSIPVFLFPSFAEGSARVVFEALASRCYVITTPNAGSVVEDGVHGALVAPGDSDALRAAVVQAGADRERLVEVGDRNARIVADQFRQADYGDSLTDVYRRLDSGWGPA